MNENFEPIHEFVTDVEVNMYDLPKNVDTDSSKAKVYWKMRTILKKSHFELQIWLDRVEVTSIWTYLDDEGEFLKEEEKFFTYSAEDVQKGEPESDEIRHTVMPSEVDVTLMPSGKDVVTVEWN